MRAYQTNLGTRGLCGLGVAAMLVGLVLAVAGPAAGNVLFRMSSGSCSVFADPNNNCSGRPFPTVGGTVNGPTLMTTPTAGGANFTIPSKLFSTMGSFTGSYGPYPYFQASYTRYNKGGQILASAWTPNVTKTFVDNDTQYPYATATPHPGFVRAKIGPKGNAGSNVFYVRSYYTGTYLTPGINYVYLLIVGDRTGFASNIPSIVGIDGGYNVTNMTSRAAIVHASPHIWPFTGTLTVSQPGQNPQYIMHSALDNRTAAGASGTIQLITAGLGANYNVIPPATGDGTATVLSYRNANLFARRTTFEFIPAPEPVQMALIGVGIAGLAGVWMMRRR